MDSRIRRLSPPGNRRIGQGGRQSTGTLVYPSPFDQIQGTSRSSTGLTSGPRTSAERMLPPRTLPRYRQESPHRNRPRDDYVIRPRGQTLDPHDAVTRRPLSVIAPSSPNRMRPVITSAVERPSSPMIKPARPRHDEDYYIEPASSVREHRRHYTADSIDTGRLTTGERREAGGYSRSGGGGRSGYNVNQPLVRPQDKDSYEYGSRREPMYSDTAPRPRPRRDSNASIRERPVSMVGPGDYTTRLNQPGDAGPPITMNTRGFANIGRSGSLRQGQRARDDNYISREYPREDYETSQTRRAGRAPVSLHQNIPETYSTYREDHRETSDGRHHRHHKPSVDGERIDSIPRLREPFDDYDLRVDDRSKKHHDGHRHRDHNKEERDYRLREDPPRERHDKGNEISTNGLAGAAAAAAAAAGATYEGTRRHHHRDRDRGDRVADLPKERVPDDDRDQLSAVTNAMESTSISTETSDPDRRERHERRRRRRREKEERAAEDHRRETGQAAEPIPAQTAPQIAPHLAPPAESTLNEQGSHERLSHDRPSNDDKPPRSPHRHHHHSRSHDRDSYSESSSSDSSLDARARQVRVVTPSQDSHEPEQPRKGILRQPREKFPEDPVPVREGVKPLKDNVQKGIPPNARWTKIDRKRVNPEALEEGNERFVERPDHVIVLRVLTKEDIEEYAKKTQEIREKRGLLTMGDHESH